MVLSVLGWRKQPDPNRTSPVTTSARTYTTFRDSIINGEVYDHYAPSTDNVRSIWGVVKEKVAKGQASNIVIGLQDSGADEAALRRQFADWPIDGLGEVLIVRPDGTIGGL